MWQEILSNITGLMKTAREVYGVDPIIFLVIYFISVPFFYFSLFRMLRAIAKKFGNEIMLWSAVFLCANVAPFLYVMAFGHNLPWWVYVVIALLIGQGIYSVTKKLITANDTHPPT